jgi:hypothetical protein
VFAYPGTWRERFLERLAAAMPIDTALRAADLAG